MPQNFQKRNNDNTLPDLTEALNRRILVLDGAMGTMIQSLGLTEADYHLKDFTPDERRLAGCNDLLAVTAPDKIEEIHRRYIAAGADIIETDTFNANAISLDEYGLSDKVTDICHAAVKVARRAAESAPHKVWVAGSVGPTNKSLSLGGDYDELLHAYTEQIYALITEGVDLLLFETIFDSLNAKCAIEAMQSATLKAGREVPCIFSVTLTESGRTLSGQSLEAFIITIAHAHPLAVGLNCGFGVEQLAPIVTQLAAAPYYTAFYPNAGLPDIEGHYNMEPEKMADQLGILMGKGYINIVGGCCGTTPEHIAAIAVEAHKHKPRKRPEKQPSVLKTAGLDAFTATPGQLIRVGERCNVAGSRKFLNLISAGNYDEALQIAHQQADMGVDIIDVNTDEPMLDSSECMLKFLSAMASDPDVARKTVMIDSSDWQVIEAALRAVQGKPIVNSISLKEGEEEFLRKAAYIHRHGAAMVIMAFDEQGQADTLQRRIDICRRAYNLLTRKLAIPPADIIFDPNILTIATGIAGHDRYGIDFIEATEWIKRNLPGANVSGGVSNLSFAFRGNNRVREAMHTVFLHYASQAGMDMAIVNPATSLDPATLDSRLREAVENLIFCRVADAQERLITIAQESTATPPSGKATTNNGQLSIDERIINAVRSGQTSHIETLIKEAMLKYGSAIKVIDGPLMMGMDMVGKLFGEGKLFLPQVVKSASVMKTAVTILTPEIERERSAGGSDSPTAKKMILATVKGDVHDIGKNIVGIIMKCNGYEVKDLGVMVEPETIVQCAIDENASLIGVSGLITPSLKEMCNVAEEMERRGLDITLAVGGAATTERHTSLKIAPLYSGNVIHTRNAAALPGAVANIQSHQSRPQGDTDIAKQPMLSVTDARRLAMQLPASNVTAPHQPGVTDIEITAAQARTLINWRQFFHTWGLDAAFSSIADISGCDHCRAQWLAATPESQRLKAAEAMQLWKEANRVLDAWCKPGAIAIHVRVALLPAGSSSDDIIALNHNGKRIDIPVLRTSHTDINGVTISLADYLRRSSDAEPYPDWAGVFAVSVDGSIGQKAARLRELGDEYTAHLYLTLAHVLAEAATELMHYKVRTEVWGYAPDESPDRLHTHNTEYAGIRPAIGYPSLPDQSIIFITDKIIDYKSLGISLTEHGAMTPTASTTGLIFSHPAARYFAIGDVNEEQVVDYARRCGKNIDSVRHYMQ
ncbi:MAG: methionine synthase [Paramuribaculum sp.]|nr:methionine synthase [Paramuribaculum sp.]